MEKYFKCAVCENVFTSKECKCPKCGSDDLYEMKEIKSKTNWNYVNACFKD